MDSRLRGCGSARNNARYAYQRRTTTPGHTPMKHEPKLTGMYELLEAIESAIDSAEPTKRKTLKQTIDAYVNDFPEEYFWAIGPQSPMLLHHVMHAIEPR